MKKYIFIIIVIILNANSSGAALYYFDTGTEATAARNAAGCSWLGGDCNTCICWLRDYCGNYFYYPKDWTVGCISTQQCCDVYANNGMSCSNCEPTQCQISASASAGGQVCEGDACSSNISYSECGSKTFTAAAEDGYLFSRWEYAVDPATCNIEVSGSEITMSATAGGSCLATAYFEEGCSVKARALGPGNVCHNSNCADVVEISNSGGGCSPVFTAAPSEIGVFEFWSTSGDCSFAEAGNIINVTANNISSSCSADAYFRNKDGSDSCDPDMPCNPDTYCTCESSTPCDPWECEGGPYNPEIDPDADANCNPDDPCNPDTYCGCSTATPCPSFCTAEAGLVCCPDDPCGIGEFCDVCGCDTKTPCFADKCSKNCDPSNPCDPMTYCGCDTSTPCDPEKCGSDNCNPADPCNPATYCGCDTLSPCDPERCEDYDPAACDPADPCNPATYCGCDTATPCDPEKCGSPNCDPADPCNPATYCGCDTATPCDPENCPLMGEPGPTCELCEEVDWIKNNMSANLKANQKTQENTTKIEENTSKTAESTEKIHDLMKQEGADSKSNFEAIDWDIFSTEKDFEDAGFTSVVDTSGLDGDIASSESELSDVSNQIITKTQSIYGRFDIRTSSPDPCYREIITIGGESDTLELCFDVAEQLWLMLGNFLIGIAYIGGFLMIMRA